MCNFKFSSSHVIQQKGIGAIGFNNLPTYPKYSQYVITVDIVSEIFHTVFHTKSLKSGVYFTLTSHFS